jgi:NitT/TauT family transport system permease protein
MQQEATSGVTPVPVADELAAERGLPGRIGAGLRARSSTFISIFLAIAIWEIVGRLTSPLIFAPFSATIRALWEITLSGRLARDLSVSGVELGVGLVLGAIIGVAGAVASYVNKPFREITDTWISALYTTPYVALSPLFIVWLGLGIESKIALVLLASFIPIWLSTYTGLTGTDSQLKEVAVAFGASRAQVLRYIVLPWALPNVITGFRLGLSRGIIAVVVGELIGATAGIGVLIDFAGNTFDTPMLLAGVLVLVLIALVIIEALRWFQRKMVPWWDIKENQ